MLSIMVSLEGSPSGACREDGQSNEKRKKRSSGFSWE